MKDFSNELFEDVAEDFFAESDEILSSIRRGLLRIDDLKGQTPPDKHVLEDLLRSCHTLKGLTGMVGAAEISNLTHILENYLKSVYESGFVISPESLDIVFSAVNMLQQQLAAFRNKTEMPGTIHIIENLNKIIGTQKHDNEDENMNMEITNESSVKTEGEKIWRIFFRPYRELFEKGININTVRNKISQAGKIINSMPKTGKDGSITFEFVIMSKEPVSLFESWADWGITFESANDSNIPDDSKNPEDGNFTEIRSQNTDSDQITMTSKNVVRVDLNRLEELMQVVGDMVITRLRLDDHLHKLTIASKNETRAIYENVTLMERQLRDLRNGIMKLRLVPVSEAFERMRFVIRDLIRESRKSIALEMEGQDIQIDKYIMEKMLDSLLHLVRNAVSHGIETSEERISKGKPATGKILLKASTSGDTVKFEIEDDGRGIDREKIMKKAVSSGFLSRDEEPDDKTILDIITAPGFTTRGESDMASGRGIGLDVVRRNLAELGGTIRLESLPGKSTRFLIHLPLTLSIVDALIVSVGRSVFAVPMPFVNEIVRVTTFEITANGENELVRYRDTILPLLRLSRFFKLREENKETLDILITGQGIDMAGIAVEKILGKKEIVVRSLSDPLVKVEGISGATELGEGKVILIIDIPAVLNSATRKNKITKNMEAIGHG